MAITYVGAGTASNTSAYAASVTPGVPAGYAANDLLVIVAHYYGASGVTIATPSGWTQVGTNVADATYGTLAVFYKVAGSSESAPTVATSPSTSGKFTAQMFAFRGVDTANPIDVAGSQTTRTATTTWTGSALTTNYNRSMLIFAGGSRDDNTWGTWGGGITNGAYTANAASTNDNSIFIGYDANCDTKSAGAKTAPSAVQLTLGGDAGRHITFALRGTDTSTPAQNYSETGTVAAAASVAATDTFTPGSTGGTAPTVENYYRLAAGGATNATPSVNVSTGGANRVLLAFTQDTSPGTGGDTISVSGGGLTWAKVADASLLSGVDLTQGWGTDVWWALAPTQLTDSLITWTRAEAGGDGDFVVVVVAGADTADPIGASAAAGDYASGGNPAITLTPEGGSSLILAAFNGSADITTALRSGTTGLDHTQYGGDNYDTVESDSSPAQGSPYTIGATGLSTSWTGVAVEIKPPPAATLTEKSVTSALASIGNGSVTVTVSGTNSIPSGALVLALGSCNASLNSAVPTATGLTFTTRRWEGAQGGEVAIFTAVAASDLSNVAINWQPNDFSVPALTVVVLTGADTANLSNVASTYYAPTATDFTQAITRAGASSYVYAVANGYWQAGSASPDTGCIELTDLPDTLQGNANTVVRTSALGTGAVTVGTTWDVGQDGNIAAIEIRAASGGGTTINETGTVGAAASVAAQDEAARGESGTIAASASVAASDAVALAETGVVAASATVAATDTSTAFGLDAGFPKVTTHSAGSTTHPIVSPTFSTNGPSLLVVMWAEGAVGSALPASIGGAGLTWSSAADSPLSGTYANWLGVNIWTADSPGALTDVAVTVTPTTPYGHGAALLVYSFTGAAVGAVDAAENGDATQTGRLTMTVGAGSVLLCIVADGATAAGLTPYQTGITVATDASATDGAGGNTTSILAVRSTSALAAQAYDIGHANDHGYTSIAAIEIRPASAGTQYVETGTVAAAASVAASDAVARGETGTVAAAASTAGQDAITRTETGAVAAVASVAGQDAVTRTETGTIAGAASTAASDAVLRGEAGTVAADASLAATDAVQRVETGVVAAVADVQGTDTFSNGSIFTESGSVAAVASTAAQDAVALAETGVVAATAAQVGADVRVLGESGSVAGAASVVGADAVQRVEAGTVAGAAAISGTDAAVLVEAGTVAVAANVQGTDTFSQGGVFVETGTVAAAAAVASTDALLAVEAGTVAGAGATAGTDAAVWVEAGTVAGAASSAATDSVARPEVGTVAAAASVVGVDQRQLLEAGTVAAEATVLGTDTFTGSSAYVETGTVAAQAAVASLEAVTLVNLGTVAAAATVASQDGKAIGGETGTASGVAAVTGQDSVARGETSSVAVGASVAAWEGLGLGEAGSTAPGAILLALDAFSAWEQGTALGAALVLGIDDFLGQAQAPPLRPPTVTRRVLGVGVARAGVTLQADRHDPQATMTREGGGVTVRRASEPPDLTSPRKE